MTFDNLDEHIKLKLPMSGYFVFGAHELQAIQDFMCKPHYTGNQQRMVTVLEQTFMDRGSEGVIKDDIKPGGL